MKLLLGFMVIFFVGIAYAEPKKDVPNNNQTQSKQKAEEMNVKSAGASVYKCTLENGKVTYQQRKCQGEIPEEQLKIKTFDEEKTIEAQQKLEQRLENQQKQEAEAAKTRHQEQQLKAQQQANQTKQQLIQAAERNSQAIQQNTNAVNSNGQRSNVYYMNPPVATPKK